MKWLALRLLPLLAAASLLAPACCEKGAKAPAAGAAAAPAEAPPAARPKPPAREATRGPVDATQLSAISKQALTALKAKDFVALAKLSPSARQRKVAALAPGAKRYERLVGAGGWRAAALAAWDGAIGELRERWHPKKKAHVVRAAFGAPADGQQPFVVLRHVRRDDAWRFEGVGRVKTAQWGSWGKALP